MVAAWQNSISLVTCSPAYVLREIYLISYLIRRISHIIAASALVSWLLIAKSVPPTPYTSVGKIVDRTAQRKIRLRPYRFLKNAENMLNCLYSLNKAAYKTRGFWCLKAMARRSTNSSTKYLCYEGSCRIT